jgi:O-antigen/teichoic acid export membrane protein
MKRDFLITAISNAFCFICGIVVYKLAANGFGPTGFGEYALVKRAVSFMQPVLIMGLDVGLARYLAISSVGKDNASKQASYVVAGYGSVLIFSILIMTVINLAPGLFGKAVFGNPGYESFIRVIAYLGESYLVSYLVFAYYRGIGNFIMANAITALNQGIIPLTALLFFGSVKNTLIATASGIFVVAFVFSIPIMKKVIPHVKDLKWVSSLKELLRYGLARVPGDLCEAGFTALPAFLTANMFGVKDAGYVAFGLSMVSMVGAIFQPIGLITLPRLSSIVSAGKHGDARTILHKVVAYTALISAGVTVILYLSTGYIVRYWLGPQFAGATGIARLAILAAVPNALYVSLRSSIDAAYVKAINAGNVYRALSVSLIAYLVVVAAHLNVTGIPLSYLLGMVVLCSLTLKVVSSTYGLTLKLGFRDIRP